jgi:hypothetical protein
VTSTDIASPYAAGTAKIVPTANGAAIAWSNGSGKVFVSQLDATGRRTARDLAFDGGTVEAIAGSPDGFGILITRAANGRELAMLKVSNTGVLEFDKSITTVLDGYSHSVRLVYIGNNTGFYAGLGTWVAYYNIQPDHQYDNVTVIDSWGNLRPLGWWDCGHSIEVRAAYNPTTKTTATSCVMDYFDATDATYGMKAFGFIDTLRLTFGLNARLGAIVPTATGFLAAYAYDVNSPSTGPGAVTPTTDVVTAKIDYPGGTLNQVVNAPVYVTRTPTIETRVHMAPFAGGYVLGWEQGSIYGWTDGTMYGAWSETDDLHAFWLQRIDGAQNPIGMPAKFLLPVFGEQDFVSFADGQVGWVSTYGSPSKVRLVRVATCP